MANLIRTFLDYYRNVTDPYPDEDTFYHPFRSDPAVQPATIVNSLESNTYSVAVLMASSDHTPVLAVAPFSPPALPGAAAAANKYAFAGDVSPTGALPALVVLTNNCFHLTDNVSVRVQADAAAAWAALPAGQELLDPPAAGANAENVRTRMAMPLCHQFAAPIFQAYINGNLSWRWLSTNVCDVASADPALAAGCTELVNFIRIASTRRPGVGGGAFRDPQVEMNIPGVLTTPALQDSGLAHARVFLTGIREAVGVSAQLQMQTTQLQALGQAVVQANTRPPATLAEKYMPLLEQVLRLCEVATEPELADFWALVPNIKTGFRLAAAESLLSRIANSNIPSFMAPIMSPALINDVANGQFVGEINDVKNGFSVFRFLPANTPNRNQLRHRNQVYMATVTEGGAAGLPAINVMLTDSELHLPQSSEEFRGYIEGFSVACDAFLGPHSRILANFKTQVANIRNDLITNIEQFYPSMEQRRLAWALILMYIYRLFNDYFKQLLAADMPVATGTLALRAPAVAPDFSPIRERLMEGNLLNNLTTLPSTFYENAPVERPALPAAGLPRQGGAPLAGGGGGGGGAALAGGAGRGDPNRRVINLPHQNPNLKAAWAATGIRSVYGSASPFYDPDMPKNRKVVPSDTPGMRICLPCALTGICYDNCTGKHGTLTAVEVNRVAAAGNLVVEEA